MILLNYKLFSKILLSLILIATCIAAGTLGYIIIEDYTTANAFYMTIITVSTVGFGEVQALSDNGKIFTTILIFFSFGAFAYALSSISSYLLGGEYNKVRAELRNQKKISIMKNHVIICGFGRVGRQIAADFTRKKQAFIIIENNKERAEQYKNELNYTFVLGDATADANLEKANINNACAIITCMPNDANNLYVVLAAKEINPSLQIIARASKIDTVKKLKFAGASSVIMPDSVGGSHMASLVTRPDIMEFMDEIRLNEEHTPNIIGLPYHKLPDVYKDKTVGEMEKVIETGCSIVGFKTADGEYIINPTKGVKISKDTKLFVLGDSNQIKSLKKYFDFL